MIPPIQASRFEELEPLLAEELSKIRNTPGKVSDFTKSEAMQKLSNSIIPSASQKLADLQGAVDAAEQNYQQIRLRQKICSNSFEAAVQKFHTALDTALRSYAYLNEGYGQFEEYEWSDQAEDEETDEYLQGVDFDPNQLIAPPSFLGSLCQKLAAYKTFVANTVASLHQLQCWEYMQERQLAQALITCTEAFAEALVPLREVTGMEYDDYSREEELYDASTSSEIVLYDGPKARADINEDLNALCNFGCSLISSEEESDDPLTVRADINDDLNALCNFECSLINLIDWARGFAYTVHGRATLSLRYGQKVVVEAQKFCNGTPPEVLQESYGQYLRTLQTFFNEIESGSPSDEWLDTIDMELGAQDNSLHSALEKGLEAIHTRLDFLTPERPDDPNDELALRALDKEKTMFEDLLGQMKDMYQAYSSVRGSWLHRDQLAAEREKARQLIESSRRGLVKNLGKIKPNKSLQNTTSNLYHAAVT